MKQFTCPKCGSHYFGTSNCTGPMTTWIRHCHGYKQNGQPCRFSFPITDDNKYFADEQNGSKEIDMELRKEYAEIVEREQSRWLAAEIDGPDCMTNIALACQELADRPPRELTDAEIDDAAFASGYPRGSILLLRFGRAVEAAVHAKQREPQVVKFRAARPKNGGPIQMVSALAEINEKWEWLEPAQEFEVRI